MSQQSFTHATSRASIESITFAALRPAFLFSLPVTCARVCAVCKRRNLLKFQVLFALVRHFCVCFSCSSFAFFLIFLHSSPCPFPSLSLSIFLLFILFGHSNMLHTFVRQETGTATPPPPTPQVVAHVAYYSHFSLIVCLSVCRMLFEFTNMPHNGHAEREREGVGEGEERQR